MSKKLRALSNRSVTARLQKMVNEGAIAYGTLRDRLKCQKDLAKVILMALIATEYKYIELDEQQVPYIAGTTMKVVELVEAQRAYGWSPEEIHLQHRYLSMGQIHSALAYYWDHQQQLDADLERRFQYAETLRQAAGESPLAKKLRAQGLIQ